MMLRRALVCFLAVCWIAQAGVGAQSASPPAGSQAAPPAAVLVFPFEQETPDARTDWMAEAIAELSYERLAGLGRGVFSRSEFLGVAERMGLSAAAGSAGRFTRATMLKLAEQADADFVLFGSYSADGQTLRLTARVIRMASLAQSPPISASGPPEKLSELHAEVAWHAVRFMDPLFPLSRRDFLELNPNPRAGALELYIRGTLAADDAARLRAWKEAAQLDPDWDEPSYALGTAYLAAGDCPAAANWFGRVGLTSRRGTEAAFYEGLCYLRRGDFARAENVLGALAESARAKRPEASGPAPEVLNNLALARARLEKREEATALLQRAVQLRPEDDDYRLNLGLALLRSGHSIAAARAFREVVRQAPEDRVARALLVLALEQSGRLTEAAGEREASNEALPQVLISTANSLARVKMRIESPSELQASSDAALSPRRVQHLRRLLAQGRAALEAGQWPEAERHFAAAVLMTPSLREAHVGLAEALEKQNRLEESLREWRAGQHASDNAEVRLRVARLLLSFDPPRTEDARAELRAALRMNPPAKVRDESRRLLDEISRKQNGGQP